MEISKSLRRPNNWQDFETLCKKLWGEVWNCPEIKKNGRAGQAQNGVDIFGIPKGEMQYYGIQCKGKDEYTDKQFTEKEILREIEKAKQFKPDLKKLYFTTTAIKDAAIETFIRERNIAHIKEGLFEVHLFSWADIVDLIDENRETHDWYLKSQQFKTRKEVKITCNNDLNEIEREVLVAKIVTDSGSKTFSVNSASGDLFTYMNIPHKNNFKTAAPDFNTYLNCSYFSFQIKTHNTGSEPIEEYNIQLTFEGEIVAVAETNQTGGFPFIRSVHSCISIDDANKSVRISPKTMLVGNDHSVSEEIFIKPKRGEMKVLVKWKLLAKDFTDSGELNIHIKTVFRPISMTALLENPWKMENKAGDIGDYIIQK